MPKSKRNKQIELSKTKKRGLEWKKKLLEQIRSAVDSYTSVYIFSVSDMRNSKMKSVRDQWKDSRFFFGKNKIMAMALGRSAEEEYKPNLHKIGQRIKGQRALLFSSRSTDDVLSWFRSYSEGDYARSGNTATEDVILLEGPLPQFPHNLEPYLRQLGLPTSLNKGVIHLVRDHEVCKEGDILSPETAKIIKLLGYQMAEFHITINCMWSQDGTFLKFTEDEETDSKENKSKNKRKSNSTVAFKTPSSPLKAEEMEVEDGEMSDSSVAPQLQEIESSTQEVMVEKNETSVSPPESSNITAITSTPKEKISDSVENGHHPEECNKNLEEYTIISAEKEIIISEDTPANRINMEAKDTPVNRKKKKVGKPSKNINEIDDSNTRQSRPRKRLLDADKVLEKSTLPMTPDRANSSQDSPLFRELRNRSVKVNRKRNK